MQLDWNKLLSARRRIASPKLRGDFRSELERDYDRALFSTPVRRLQDKAQVFPLESNDSIRTRLTHSIEVSSIARTLGRYCAPFIVKSAQLPDGRRRDIEMLCQTCGLLHDVGNPPFGHSGEKAIAGWFEELLAADPDIKRQIVRRAGDRLGEQRLRDFTSFDGNSQTFRILTRLQLIDNYAGLNFTFATLGALLKYTAPSHRTDEAYARSKKHGYFFSENDIVEAVRQETGVGSLRHPLTYLIEAADDIAYSVVDIEDALKKEVIQWQLLFHPDFKPLHKYLRRAQNIVHASEAGRGLHPFEREHACAARLRTILITELVATVIRSFRQHYGPIMDGSMKEPLEKCSDRADVFAACKRVTRQHVYFGKETLKLEIMGKKVVSDLMSLFWEGAVGYRENAKSFHFSNKVWAIMSSNYRHVYEHEVNLHELRRGGKLDHYLALHLVADNVCGMTDTFACSLHRELFNGG